MQENLCAIIILKLVHLTGRLLCSKTACAKSAMMHNLLKQAQNPQYG